MNFCGWISIVTRNGGMRLFYGNDDDLMKMLGFLRVKVMNIIGYGYRRSNVLNIKGDLSF
jgi:hypothetical protein